MKKKLQKILAKLGLTQKFENQELTAEDYSKLCEEYQKEYGNSMTDDMAAEKASAQQAEHQKQINELYGIVSKANKSQDGGDGSDNGDGNGDNGDDNDDKNKQNATYEQLASAVSTLATNVQKLSQEPAQDKPTEHAQSPAVPVNGFATTSTYLFGIEHPMFSMKKRWNQITANPRLALASDPDEQADGTSFRQESIAFAKSLMQRFRYHQERNELDAKRLAEGTFATDYSGVDNAKLGDQFVILRQDALIARILTLRNLTEFFPVRYGVQDRDILFNAFFGEVSQGYQPGGIFKGDMELEGEMGYVDDAMIKVQFGPMKEIERKYIGYLNMEGSDPIKWSMIEFCLLNLLTKAQEEQNQRRMRGIYVKPEAGVPSSSLNAGTGIWYTLLRYIHDFSIKPLDGKGYRSYTSADMLDAVKEFISDVKSHLSEGMTLDKHVLYLNENHVDWWLANCRTAYGKDLDFTGPNSYRNHVPDTNIQIKWLPYEGQSHWMFLDIPGNLQFVEYLPGEMLAVKMEEHMEEVLGWSTWKEGTGAAFTGKKFTTKKEMDDNDYEFQQIFTNIPAADLVDSVDAKDGFWHMTNETTTASSISTIAHAKKGVAYCIEIGAETTTMPKIAKSGEFENITDAWNPTAEGDYIMVILGKDNKYRELERRVGGKRTINKEVQPNVPGGR